MARSPLVEIAYEGILWKQSYWIKSWRKRWCILTASGTLYCFKERHKYSEETEVFELREYGDGNAFTQYRLLQNHPPNELVFELSHPGDKVTRKFKIIDEEFMQFFSQIQSIMGAAIPTDDPSMNALPSSISPAFISQYLNHEYSASVNATPNYIIDIIYNYVNANNFGSSTMAVLFKNHGLQFMPIAGYNAKTCVNMQIYSVHCRSSTCFKKWNFDRFIMEQLKSKYHQMIYVANIECSKLPKIFSAHPLFTKLIGAEITDVSAILTSHFSFIIYDATELKNAMHTDDNNNVMMNGIEYQLPNVHNKCDELKYYKMHYSTRHGLIAFKDNDIYKLDINSCKSSRDLGTNVVWRKMSNFPKQLSISSMCWLTENKLFACGQNAVIMDLKNEKYHKMSDKLLDEFILFPCALAFNFMFDCVVCVGGSNSNKAQIYDISKSKWFHLQQTVYSHDGQDCASNIWFDETRPYFVYVCSYYNDQIRCEKLDIRDTKNKWTPCDVLEGVARRLDFATWHFQIVMS